MDPESENGSHVSYFQHVYLHVHLSMCTFFSLPVHYIMCINVFGSTLYSYSSYTSCHYYSFVYCNHGMYLLYLVLDELVHCDFL